AMRVRVVGPAHAECPCHLVHVADERGFRSGEVLGDRYRDVVGGPYQKRAQREVDGDGGAGGQADLARRLGGGIGGDDDLAVRRQDRKSTRLNISYAVFCLKKKNLLQPTAT